jgi:hypothetical protein
MEPANSESPEVSARKKHVAELVELAIERAKDYDLPSDALRPRPT